MDKARNTRRNPFNSNAVRRIAFKYYQHNLGRQLQTTLNEAGTSFNLTTFKRPTTTATSAITAAQSGGHEKPETSKANLKPTEKRLKAFKT
ncbi:hypothetical protein DOY81_014526 [Sarcophaga bullata]|nr:hypothetical protein DOY81_014526 [Sarcophaga bullata]